MRGEVTAISLGNPVPFSNSSGRRKPGSPGLVLHSFFSSPSTSSSLLREGTNSLSHGRSYKPALAARQHVTPPDESSAF